MNKISIWIMLVASIAAAGCGQENPNPKAEAPPPAQVEHEQDGGVLQVDHPEQIPLVSAVARASRPELVVTGVVTPDISRNVPVVSLASGRVVEIRGRLGDTVKKGDVLLRVRSDDISGGYSDYRKAVADEELARAQFERAEDLHAHGAISMNDLQIARDTEEKAKVDLETTAGHLRLLGSDPDKPDGIVEIHAPVSGVITDQQVTDAALVQAYGPNPFTISDSFRGRCIVRQRDRLKVGRQRADLRYFLWGTDQEIFVREIQPAQRPHHIASVRAHAELGHPPNINGDLHGKI